MSTGLERGTQKLQSPTDSLRIAVLPFANISPDAKDEYFADGLTEELISTLSKITSLKVIARTSVMRYKATAKSISEVGRELNVGTLLEGSVRKADSKIRITTKLVDAQTEEHLWSQDYDRDLKDIFTIQSDIAQRIASALKVQLLKDEKQDLEKKKTENTEAYALYLKGRYYLNQRTQLALKQAIDYFEEALKKDPTYALAYTGLSDSHAIMALFEFLAPKEAFPKARSAAEKALQIEPHLAEAHTSIGVVRFQYEWDWQEAEKEFKQAIELNPNYPASHQFYADYLKAMGRFDEALAEMRRALALDPLSLSINCGVGHILYLSRQYDLAIEQYQKVVQLDPTFPQGRLWFGRPYLQKGMYKEAIAELNEAVKLSGADTISLAVLGHAYASSGEKDKAETVLERLKERAKQQYVAPYFIALIYVGLGSKKQALELLERAFQERSSWLVWIKVEPRYDPLRKEPRFAAMLAQMRLTSDHESRRAKELGIKGWLKGPK